MNLPSHHKLLAEQMNFWAANCNREGVPDIVKCTGIVFPESLDGLTFFISDRFSEVFRANLHPGIQLAFMGCDVPTYESYQYKGEFVSIRSCTPEEELMQRNYVDAITDAIQNIGYEKKDFFELYYHQPSHALTMTVKEIFEQTPRTNTGNVVINKGSNL